MCWRGWSIEGKGCAGFYADLGIFLGWNVVGLREHYYPDAHCQKVTRGKRVFFKCRNIAGSVNDVSQHRKQALKDDHNAVIGASRTHLFLHKLSYLVTTTSFPPPPTPGRPNVPPHNPRPRYYCFPTGSAASNGFCPKLSTLFLFSSSGRSFSDNACSCVVVASSVWPIAPEGLLTGLARDAVSVSCLALQNHQPAFRA